MNCRTDRIEFDLKKYSTDVSNLNLYERLVSLKRYSRDYLRIRQLNIRPTIENAPRTGGVRREHGPYQDFVQA